MECLYLGTCQQCQFGGGCATEHHLGLVVRTGIYVCVCPYAGKQIDFNTYMRNHHNTMSSLSLWLWIMQSRSANHHPRRSRCTASHSRFRLDCSEITSDPQIDFNSYDYQCIELLVGLIHIDQSKRKSLWELWNCKLRVALVARCVGWRSAPAHHAGNRAGAAHVVVVRLQGRSKRLWIWIVIKRAAIVRTTCLFRSMTCLVWMAVGCTKVANISATMYILGCADYPVVLFQICVPWRSVSPHIQVPTSADHVVTPAAISALPPAHTLWTIRWPTCTWSYTAVATRLQHVRLQPYSTVLHWNIVQKNAPGYVD